MWCSFWSRLRRNSSICRDPPMSHVITPYVFALVFIAKARLHVKVQYYTYCMFMCNSLIESKIPSVAAYGSCPQRCLTGALHRLHELSHLFLGGTFGQVLILIDGAWMPLAKPAAHQPRVSRLPEESSQRLRGHRNGLAIPSGRAFHRKKLVHVFDAHPRQQSMPLPNPAQELRRLPAV